MLGQSPISSLPLSGEPDISASPPRIDQVISPPTPARFAVMTAYILIATFVPQSEPSLAVAGGESLPDRVQVPLRAAPSAYVLALPSFTNEEPDTAEIQNGLELPDLYNVPGRAPPSAYVAQFTTFVNDEPDVAEIRLGQVLPSQYGVPGRASLTAYQLSVPTFVVDAPDVVESQIGLLLPDRYSVPGRAALSAYELSFPTFVISTPEVEESRIGLSLPTRYEVAQRAASSAYNIWSFVVPDASMPPGQNDHVSQFQYIPGRATKDAYWFTNRLAVQEVTPPPAVTGQLVSQPIQYPRRASNDAYWIPCDDSNFESEPPVYRHSFQNAAPGPRQAGLEAYSIAATFVVADEPHGQLISLPDSYRVPRRAGVSAYWRDVQAVVSDEPYEFQRCVFPSRYELRGRASVSAYVVISTFVGANAPPENQRVVMSDSYRVPGRAAASAYGISIAPAISDEFPGVLPRVSMPDRVKYLRAAQTAYQVFAQAIAEDLPGDRSRGFIDTHPRLPRRASLTAYAAGLNGFIPSLPSDVSVSGPVNGPFFADAGLVYQAGAVAGRLFQVGAEAGKVESI